VTRAAGTTARGRAAATRTIDARSDEDLVALVGRGRRPGHGRAPRALPRVRPGQGPLVLPRRRRPRGHRAGGDDRPLQGHPRLRPRSRRLVPLLRRAVHHPPDPDGHQDRHPPQARPAQHLRVVRPSPGRRRRTARSATASPPRSRSTRSSRWSPPTSSVGCSRPSSRCCRASRPRCCPLRRGTHLPGDRRPPRSAREVDRQRPAAHQAQARTARRAEGRALASVRTAPPPELPCAPTTCATSSRRPTRAGTPTGVGSRSWSPGSTSTRTATTALHLWDGEVTRSADPRPGRPPPAVVPGRRHARVPADR
jgi:hypothetical protein